jgi:hypothetical protein
MSAGTDFLGLWRPGSGPQWWYFGDDYERFTARDQGYFASNFRLTRVFPYPGSCDSQCLNQVVMTSGSYNYGISETKEHCPGLPGSGRSHPER